MERFIPGPSSIVLSHHTLRYASFDERVAAAAAAGCDGVGLSLRAYRKLLDEGWSDKAMLDVLDRYEQRLVEAEALAGWAESGDRRELAAADETLVHHLADVFGVWYLQAIGPFDGTIDDAAEAFAGVCDRAAEHGLVVGIEFLPFTNVPDLTTALTIAEAAGRPNGGLCLDAWHFFRGVPDFDVLAQVPGDRIVDVQIDDGPLQPELPDYFEDCLLNRRPPGEGEFDLVRLIQTLDDIGSRAPLSIEVISTELQALPASDAARRVTEATRALVSAARAA